METRRRSPFAKQLPRKSNIKPVKDGIYMRKCVYFQQQGIQLIITNAQSSDAGRYICVCVAEDGQEFESEYELNVETPPARNEIKPPQIEHAEAGSTVVLNCNPGQYANRYHWSRQQGHFAAGTDISSVSFSN